MYNLPTNLPHKLKRPQTRPMPGAGLQQTRPQFKPNRQPKPKPQFNPGPQQTRPMPSAPINGGSTADVVTDTNGMVSATRPRPVPFSPSSDRTVEMNDPARFPQGNAGNPKLPPRFKGKPLM